MKRLLIIGGTGSLGYALTNKYIDSYKIFCMSRDECKQWEMKKKINSDNFETIIGDMRDYNRTEYIISKIKPEIIIIAAAMKHIDICEKYISECIKTNIIGIDNILDASEKFDFIETVLFVSTDKACNPMNVYGMCKSISERSVISRSFNNEKTKYLCVRYGNVLNSRGSIIPLLENFRDKPYYELTHPNMTRYIMTLDESVTLIDYALNHGENGDIVIPHLQSINIKDLIELYAEKYNKEIKISGIRQGEKLFESLVSDSEIENVEINDNFIIIKNHNVNKKHCDAKDFSSYNNMITKNELYNYLVKLCLI